MNVAQMTSESGRPLALACRHGHAYDDSNTRFWTSPTTGKSRRLCRACQRAADARNHRKGEWRRRYGMTPGDYEALLEAQGGACAICRGPQSAKYRVFDVDHDHATGRVRGLLCRRCNTGLGYLENEGYRESALSYLRGGESDQR